MAELDEVLARGREHAIDDDAVRAEREALEQARRAEQLDDSGVSAVLTESALRFVVADQLEATQSLEEVRSWMHSSLRPGSAAGLPVLGLFGDTDAGKTVAAAYALAHVPGARYHELGDLARHMPDPDRKHPDAVWAAALDTRLLVLDELGMEDDARRARAALHHLVNRRLRKRTLLIANLDEDTWRERYDPRTLSRLQEVARLVRVEQAGLRARVGRGELR